MHTFRIQRFDNPCLVELRIERINDDEQLAEKILAVQDLLYGFQILTPRTLVGVQARWWRVTGIKVAINPAPQSSKDSAGASEKPVV